MIDLEEIQKKYYKQGYEQGKRNALDNTPTPLNGDIIEEFKFALNCLALEVPGAVYDDFCLRSHQLLNYIAALENQWQPIETAPNGQHLGLMETGDIIITSFGGKGHYFNHKLTHWMPLPPKPTTKSEV